MINPFNIEKITMKGYESHNAELRWWAAVIIKGAIILCHGAAAEIYARIRV